MEQVRRTVRQLSSMNRQLGRMLQREALPSLLTVRQAASRTGLSVEALEGMLHVGTLLLFPTPRGRFIPASECSRITLTDKKPQVATSPYRRKADAKAYDPRA
jgi:hypothetical protein